MKYNWQTFTFHLFCSSVAQLVEQTAVNRLVVGSSPTAGAILSFHRLDG